MSSLSLNLFGAFAAFLDGQPLENPGIKSLALLIYLAVERDRPHRRESLFTLLWPGMPEKSARHNLNQTVYALRQVIPDHDDNNGETTPLLLGNRHTIQLNQAVNAEVDIHQMDDLLESTQTHAHHDLAGCATCFEALQDAQTLYQGDFLSTFYLEDSSEFEAWAEAVRETYRRKVIEALATLADLAIQQRDNERALTYIDRQLVLDDLNESAHRQKIQVLSLAGRRVEAMRQYRALVQNLDEQLGTGPSLETTDLYEHIRSEDLAVRHPFTVQQTSKPAMPRHNLPPQPTPFIGRQQELAQLDEMLIDPDIRLITIVGPGGMGKTRLAIACAERNLAHEGNSESHPFSDGIFFVPLSSAESQNQIPKAILTSLDLGMIPRGGMMDGRSDTVDPSQQLMEYLERKQILLVLDNFEQLISYGKLLANLLNSAPQIKILVTSRERLYLLEEQVFPILGLTFPLDAISKDPLDYSAIQLFQQSAMRLRPSFDLTSDNLVDLNHICRMVDGLPLGLELAASWVEILSVEEIAAEIQRSIGFLTTDTVNIPERHRSLTAVFDSSWNYLSSFEQKHFSALSVFRGGFTRNAAQQVTGASLRALGILVKKSLLQFSLTEERYRFHPYLRQVATDKLATTPEDEHLIRNAHCAYYCAALEAHQETIECGQSQIAFERIEIDFANIQAAWEWAVKQRNLEHIYQGLDGLCLYCWNNRRLNEGLTTCQNLNEMLANAPSNSSISGLKVNPDLYERVHAKLLSWEGKFNYFYDSAEAKRLFGKSMKKLSRLERAGHDVRREKAQLLIFQVPNTDMLTNKSGLQKAITLLHESLSLLREQEPDYWMLLCILELSVTSSLLGSHLEARTWAEQGYSLAEEQNNQDWEVEFLLQLGRAARGQGEYDSAKKYFERALSLAEEFGMQDLMEQILRTLGHMANFLGRLDESAASLTKANVLAEEKIGIEYSLTSLGSLCIAQWLAGDFGKAEKTIRTAVNRTQNLTTTKIIYPNICHIEFLAISGRYHEADYKIKQKADWSRDLNLINWPFYSSRLTRILGWILLVENSYPEAVEHFQASIECLPFYNEFIAWSQPFLAYAYFGLEKRDAAEKLLTEALTSSIDTQNYIPIVFSLPISLLILAEDDLEFVSKTYKQVRCDPFMSKAQLFHDLVYKHLPEEINSILVKMVEHTPEHRNALWDTARLVLKKLVDKQGK